MSGRSMCLSQKKLISGSLITFLAILVSLETAQASPMDQLMNSKYPFKDLFNKKLYDLENKHPEYDSDQVIGAGSVNSPTPGQPAAQQSNPESPEQTKESALYKKMKAKLLDRKKKKVEDTLIRDLESYKLALSKSASKNLKEDVKVSLGRGVLNGLKNLAIDMTMTSIGGVSARETFLSTLGRGLLRESILWAIDRGEASFLPAAEIGKIDESIVELKNMIEEEEIWPIEQKYLMIRIEYLELEEKSKNDESAAKRAKSLKRRLEALETALLESRDEFKHSFGSLDPRKLAKELSSFPLGTLIAPGVDADSAEDFIENADRFIDEIFPSLGNASPKSPLSPSSSTSAASSVSSAQENTKPKSREYLDSPHYSVEIREKLKEITQNLITFSKTRQSVKKCFLFYGAPGTGKTMAAELLADALDLPLKKIKIDPKNLSQAFFQGSKVYESYPGPMRGEIPSVLLQTNKNGETAENAIALLNDITQYFPISGNQTESANVMNFLLDFIDLKQFEASYYGVELTAENLIIILTMNHDIRDQKYFEALESRCEFVDFEAPSKEHAREGLRDWLPDTTIRYSRAVKHIGFKNMTEADRRTALDTIKDQIINFVLDNYYIKDQRKQQERALALTNVPMGKWKDYAEKNKWMPSRGGSSSHSGKTESYPGLNGGALLLPIEHPELTKAMNSLEHLKSGVISDISAFLSGVRGNTQSNPADGKPQAKNDTLPEVKGSIHAAADQLSATSEKLLSSRLKSPPTENTSHINKLPSVQDILANPEVLGFTGVRKHARKFLRNPEESQTDRIALATLLVNSAIQGNRNDELGLTLQRIHNAGLELEKVCIYAEYGHAFKNNHGHIIETLISYCQPDLRNLVVYNIFSIIPGIIPAKSEYLKDAGPYRLNLLAEALKETGPNIISSFSPETIQHLLTEQKIAYQELVQTNISGRSVYGDAPEAIKEVIDQYRPSNDSATPPVTSTGEK